MMLSDQPVVEHLDKASAKFGSMKCPAMAMKQVSRSVRGQLMKIRCTVHMKKMPEWFVFLLLQATKVRKLTRLSVGEDTPLTQTPGSTPSVDYTGMCQP